MNNKLMEHLSKAAVSSLTSDAHERLLLTAMLLEDIEPA